MLHSRKLSSTRKMTNPYIKIPLPPNESRSNLVSFESRNGTCALFSASALIHLPNALKDKLIDLASSSVCPSLPAKKQKNERIEVKVSSHLSIMCNQYLS